MKVILYVLVMLIAKEVMKRNVMPIPNVLVIIFKNRIVNFPMKTL